MCDVSVVVCTRNPRTEYLARVGESLQRQSLPRDRWELLVVDSGSSRPVSEGFDVSWHPHGRHVREPAPGLTLARFRGIGETRGGLLVFVDDDNVLADDYLERALDVHRQAATLGAFGAGLIAPEFAHEPPSALRSHLPLLTIRDEAATRVTRDLRDFRAIPWGAGLCVTRQVAARYQAFVERLGIVDAVGRTPEHLYAGEDDLFSWLAVSLGFEFGTLAELQLTHLIPADRLGADYMVRLIGDHTFSAAVRQYVLMGERPSRLTIAACARLALHGLRRGPFALRCRWAVLRGRSRAAAYVRQRGLAPGTAAVRPALPDGAAAR
jgi:glycosyltransferase involved in cell wall biosynthesis